MSGDFSLHTGSKRSCPAATGKEGLEFFNLASIVLLGLPITQNQTLQLVKQENKFY